MGKKLKKSKNHKKARRKNHKNSHIIKGKTSRKLRADGRRKSNPPETPNRRVALSLVLIISGVIILAVLMVLLASKPFRRKDYMGPVIFSACDVPNQYLRLFVSVDEDGSTIIIPIWENENNIDEATFWIRVTDTYDFKWNCTGEIQATKLFGSNIERKFSSSTTEAEGIGRDTIFRIKYDRDKNYHYSTINFKHVKDNDFKYEAEGIFCVRLPWIMHWISGNMLAYIGNHSGGFPISDKEYVDTSIDNKDLFIPIISYTVSFPDLSLLNSDYDIRYIAPDANTIGLYLIWDGSMFFEPSLQYDVTKTAKGEAESNIVAIVVGIALSLIVDGIKKRGEKT